MKKIISAILVLVTLFTFTVSFADTKSEVAEIDMFVALGIIKQSEFGDIEDDKSITRIELAEIFYNIVFPNQETSSDYWGEADYPDVPAEKKHIVSAVAGLGVMKGYSDTVFAPNDPVTYNQVVKAVVSFLGYDLQADRLGGYPGGYLAQGSFLKILPEGNTSGDTPATYGTVAAILKKSINVDIAVWNHTESDGTSIQEVQKGTDYLEYYRGISVTKGTVTGNYLTNIKGGNATTNYFGVYINGKQIEVSEGAHGLQEALGFSAYVYYKVEDGREIAVYYELAENNVLEISAKNIAGVSSDEIRYYVDGDDGVYSASYQYNAKLIYNGTFESSFTVNDLNPFASGNLDGSVKLIDNDANGYYEVIVVNAYQSIVVNDVRNNKIYGMYSPTGNNADKVIDVTNYKVRNINIRNIRGEVIDITAIKKGHVANVCRDKYGNVKEIIVTKESMTGVIDEVSRQGSKITYISISGVTFPVANGVVLVDSGNKFAPGAIADVFFNAETEVALIDLESKYLESYTIGYFVDAGTDGVIEKTSLCRIFTSEGKMLTYNFAKRVVLNGVPTDVEDVLTRIGKTGNRYTRQVLLYKTDLEGKVVTAIEIPQKLVNDTQAFDGFYEYPGESYYYDGGFRCFSNSYVANDDTVTFGIPGESYRDDYDLYTITELPVGESSTNDIGSANNPASIKLYGTKKEAMVANVVVINTTAGSGSDTSRRPFFIVTKVTNAIDNEGNVGLKLSGIFVKGAQTITGGFFIDEAVFAQGHNMGNDADINNGKKPFIDQNETRFTPGDVIRVEDFTETNYKISRIDVTEFYQVYDFEDNVFMNTTGHYQESKTTVIHYVYGRVISRDGTTIKVELPDGSRRTFELSAGNYQFVEITKNKSNNEVNAVSATYEKILAEDTYPGEGSRVLIHYRGQGIACFILNDGR